MAGTARRPADTGNVSGDGRPGPWDEEEIRAIEITYSDPPQITMHLVAGTEEYEGQEARQVLAWLREKGIVR